jgi:hypothetical protein
MALITFGDRRMPSFTRFSTSLSQSFLSKSKHQMKYCGIDPFNVFVFERKMQNKKRIHFTVTDFARFLGVSGLWPLSTAI